MGFGTENDVLSLCFMTMVAAAGTTLALLIFPLLTLGWDESSAWRLGWLAQIMYPFITIVSLTALVMGMLNAKRFLRSGSGLRVPGNLRLHRRRFMPAWIIDAPFRSGVITEKGLAGFAVGTLIGGLMQLAVQLAFTEAGGFRFGVDFGWNDSGVKKCCI